MLSDLNDFNDRVEFQLLVLQSFDKLQITRKIEELLCYNSISDFQWPVRYFIVPNFTVNRLSRNLFIKLKIKKTQCESVK